VASKLTPDERQKRIIRFKDIKTLKKMASAFSADFKDYKRKKGYTVEHEISAIIHRLNRLRSEQRDREGDRLLVRKNFITETESRVRYNFSNLCEKRKFFATIIVGGKDAGSCEFTPKVTKYAKDAVTFCLGHMWYRNVWQNFYQDDRMVSKDYLVLSATEYRTNVQHIKLFQVTTFGVAEKKQVNGWVGQSKLGKQKCAFRTDRLAAIQAAQKLTVGSVNEHLKGEANV